ncbi:hypothetical protein [Paludisphaera sp.]|uniref:fused DSP-PTPase phosphatase/NAD kinase-like protein n=1 Tax=Paludisphaera sp. TaxID=2017432 RepID=UPI00301D48B3
MFSLSWSRERGINRGGPAGRRRLVKSVALGFLAATAFLQTGCRSGGFGNFGDGCGLFSGCGPAARATSRVMQPFRKLGGLCGGNDGCGPSAYDAGVIDYGVPSTVIAPAVPLGVPTTVLPGGALPSTVAPAGESATDLEPLPSAAPGEAPRSRSGSNSGLRTPSNYESRKPVQNPGIDLTQSLTTTPSASRAADASRKRAADADLDAGSPLDNIPDLDPAEVTEHADKALGAPSSVKTRSTPAANDLPAGPTPSTTSAPAHDPSGGRASGGAEPALAASTAEPAAPAADAANGALGIDRFHAVDLKLAGGSVPSTVGLGWLAEKGFLTILDLRDPSKVSPAFMTEARNRKLRYVSCPIDLSRIDDEQVDRFSAELALDAARPLYFFDDAGGASAAMWYSRRVLKDKAAWGLARREADSVGVLDAATWKLVDDYVESRVEPRPAAPAPRPPAQAQAAESHLAAADVAPAPAPPKAAAPAPPVDLGHSDAWKPFAALLVTGLSFRAAFIGRSAIPTILARSRASLPAPKPRP